MSIIDYPGPFISRIVEFMDDKKVELTEEEKRYATVAKEVINAEKLIFIIDGAKYPNFEDMGITHYIKIINKLREKGKYIEPYIVVTKSDLFIKDYPKYEDDYKGFKQFMEQKFTQNIYLKTLLTEVTNASFYPVFYHTRMGDSIPIPMRDENRNVYTYGFDKFVKNLME